MPWWVYMVVAAAIAVGALIVAAVRGAIKAHAEQLQAFSDASLLNSWTHAEKADRLAMVPKEAGRGGGRRTRHIVEGDGFTAMQYEFTTATGNTAQTHYRRVLRLDAPSNQLSIRRRTLRKTRTPTGDAELDKRWIIEGRLAPGMKSMILSHNHRSWRWESGTLTLVERGKLYPPNVEGMLTDARTFVALAR